MSATSANPPGEVVGERSGFMDAVDLILDEKRRALHAVDPAAAERIIRLILASPRVFVHGEGRSGLVVRMFAMRLMHLGKTAFVVGETVTPSVESGDLLVSISGSGTTAGVVDVARSAKQAGAKLACVTTDASSPLARLADEAMVVPAAAKQDLTTARSVQFGGSLFEQSALVVFDATFLLMQTRTGKTKAELWSRHANLE